MESKGKLDQLLDQALAEYGNVEPRPGLENRIISTLRSAPGRSAYRRRWTFALVPIAALLALTIWFAVGSRTPASLKQDPQAKAAGTVKVPVAPNTAAKQQPRVALRQTHRRNLRPANLASGSTAVSTLEQFPSAHPLTQEERLLVAYVGAASESPAPDAVKAAKDLGRLDISTLRIGNLETPRLDSAVRTAGLNEVIN